VAAGSAELDAECLKQVFQAFAFHMLGAGALPHGGAKAHAFLVLDKR
jgi:hypothetical protein